jgi:hypothetical protein
MIEHLVMGSWLSETPFGLVEFCDLRFVPEGRRSSLLKTGFFRQVMELKIRRKNPGSALGLW